MNRVGLQVVAAAFCCAFAACTAQQQNQAQRSAQSVALVTSVHAKLATIDPDSTTAVKVNASADGVVTLTGEARSPAQRAAFDSAAASVSGVKRVDDKLRVNSALRGPKETFAEVALGAKVAANIAAQTGVNAANVKPEVHDDVVTLSGTAPSAAVKATILDTARKTSGVGRVIDRIEVKP